MFRAGAILVLAAMLAAPIRILQPPHNRASTAHEHDRNASYRYDASNPLLPPIFIPQVEVQTYSFEPSTEEQAKDHSDEVKWTDKAIVLLTIVLAACGIAGAVIAGFQWGALKQQVKKLGEAIKAEIDAGKDRATENANALAAASEANKIAREIGQAQTRAYLRIKNAWLLQDMGTALVQIDIANIGQTPVKWLEIEGNAQVIADPKTRSDEIPLNPTGLHKLRWSADPGSKGRSYPCDTDIEGKTLENLIAETERKKSLAVQGTLRWETMFGETFETTFFFWAVPGPAMLKVSKKGGVVPEPQRLVIPSSVKTATYRRVATAED